MASGFEQTPPSLECALAWLDYAARAEIDLLRGDVSAASRRHQRVRAIICPTGDMHYARESACLGAEVALWAGRPGDALDEARRVLPVFKDTDLTILCGRVLAVGMRACADLAEQARARRDARAAEDAAVAADGLVPWVERMGGAPFADHPFVATIPAGTAGVHVTNILRKLGVSSRVQAAAVAERAGLLL